MFLIDIRARLSFDQVLRAETGGFLLGVQAEDETLELLYALGEPRERPRIVVVSKMI